MLASRVLITAGTPGHMYFDDKQAKWLWVWKKITSGVFTCPSQIIGKEKKKI